MTIQELFQLQKQNSVFTAVNENNTFLTDEETKTILQHALRKKIAMINSSNYLKVVSIDPEYITPTFDQVYETMIFELKNNYGWVIDEYNEQAIKSLCYYVSKDENFELIDEGYSHKKGLILIGPVGCGKTTLLKIIQKNSFNPYRFVSCRKVANDYAEFGHSAIGTYSSVQEVTKHDWFGHTNVGYCFDDLGTEGEKKNFGNQLNVMAEIILNRYDNIPEKFKTHFTTNLTADEMLKIYGERAFSRMREMLNIIEIPFDAPDRRK